MIRFPDEFDTFKMILNDEKFPKLLKMLERVNPGSGRRTTTLDGDILEL